MLATFLFHLPPGKMSHKLREKDDKNSHKLTFLCAKVLFHSLCNGTVHNTLILTNIRITFQFICETYAPAVIYFSVSFPMFFFFHFSFVGIVVLRTAMLIFEQGKAASFPSYDLT